MSLIQLLSVEEKALFELSNAVMLFALHTTCVLARCKDQLHYTFKLQVSSCSLASILGESVNSTQYYNGSTSQIISLSF